MIPEYRCFLKKEKRYVELLSINFEMKSVRISDETRKWNDFNVNYSFDDVILQAWTGKLDKNKIKCFSGDIVRDDDDKVWEVFFDDEETYSFSVRRRNDNRKLIVLYLSTISIGEFEVIGNIFKGEK